MENEDNNNPLAAYKPTAAYIGASWAVMLVGILAYLVGLWNAALQLNEKGYYFAVICLGLYAAISLQKTLRDKAEGIPTTDLYYMISWAAFAIAVMLILVGLYNADSLTLSERGFYLMSFTLSLFAAITIQKNTRDKAQMDKNHLTYKQDDTLDFTAQRDDKASILGSLSIKSKQEDN